MYVRVRCGFEMLLWLLQTLFQACSNGDILIDDLKQGMGGSPVFRCWLVCCGFAVFQLEVFVIFLRMLRTSRGIWGVSFCG